MNTILIIILIIVGLIVLLLVAVVANFLMLWLQALTSGARVTFWSLFGMKIRKVDPRTIVLTRIQSVKAGLGKCRRLGTTHCHRFRKTA